jgi:arginyl-tRNA synthetase
VRANSIFRKLEPTARNEASDVIRRAAGGDTATKDEMAKVLDGEGGDELWSLVTTAARLDEAIAQASASAEPAILAKFTFNLARSFNLFYHRYRIIAEEDATRRAVFISVADVSRRQLISALATLGIEVPERM